MCLDKERKIVAGGGKNTCKIKILQSISYLFDFVFRVDEFFFPCEGRK